MKKLLAVVGLAALLAGCASNDNGMGGTGDDSMKTDSINKTSSGQDKNSSDQYNNNATHGTGSSTAPNNATGEAMP